jgi:hypothetical protein
MIEDMETNNKLELCYQHIQRAAKLMREHLLLTCDADGLDAELDPHTAAQADVYNELMKLLDLKPEGSEWPEKDGKCQVVDINQYRSNQAPSP